MEEGNKDKAQKASPAQILERIKMSKPDTILYPTEYEVRCYVNQLVMNNKKKKGSNDSEEGCEEANDKMKIEGIDAWLRERFHGDINAKPAAVLEQMKSNIECQSLIESLTDKDIRKRISTVKQKMKAESFRNVL